MFKDYKDKWKRIIRKKNTIVVLVLIVVVAVSFLFINTRNSSVENTNQSKNDVSDDLNIYDLSPIDQEGKEKVAQGQSIDPNETWTICYYFVGSDLEDQEENDLSDLTKARTESIAKQNTENKENKNLNLLNTYAQQLQSNDLDFPEYLYEPQKPTVSTQDSSDEAVLAESEGAASSDIEEICKGVNSDKINVVIQTGGATRWSNSLINPNKTQRFTVEDGHLNEIENMPLQDSCDSNTLADFLKFCDEQYPADHRMLVLWDHGGGAFGYGKDDIYNTSMSLSDIQSALSQVSDANAEDPYFDLIGFDACLMASLENAHSLYGYGKYLVASEQTESGAGWDHKTYLKAMSKEPSMSVEEIGQTIVDSFVDYYMEKNCELGNIPFYSITTAFSLIDLNAAEQTYQSYCALNEQLLQDAIVDNHVLTKIGSAASDSTHYSGESYEIYNLIDLGNYMETLSKTYPEACESIIEQLKQSVIYHRSNGYLSESTGLNVYMPSTINSTNGLYFFLSYLEDNCEDMATRALYYYKVSGSLNDEYQSYANEKGYGQAQKLDTSSLKELSKNEITLTKKGYKLTLNDQQKDNYQSLSLEIATYDEKKNKVTNYGKSVQVKEKEGEISTNFNGKWICMDHIPLYLEIVTDTDDTTVYRSPVTINKENYYLLFSFDKESQEITLNGASLYNMDAQADASSAHVIGKTTVSLKKGDVIRPVYQVYDLKGNTFTYKKSKDKIEFNASSQFSLENLPNGEYISAIVLSDVRGDEYYSSVVEQTIKGGHLTKEEISKDFVGSTY